MENRILQPEQIIVPGEYEVGDEQILNIYFRVFDRGNSKDLPPVIVAHRTAADMLLDPAKLQKDDINYRNYRTRLKIITEY